jgi:hypothetical protein
MAYDLLSKLKADGTLGGCSITISDNYSLRGRRTIFGRDITGFTRSSIELKGGETGNERLTVPIESIHEIKVGRITVFRKKKRIERIYPR